MRCAAITKEGERSNARRAIRTLVRRRLIEEWEEDGRRYYEVNIGGWIVGMGLPLEPSDPARKTIEKVLCCHLNRRPHE